MDTSLLTQNLKSYVEDFVYKRSLFKELSIPDSTEERWIFDFKAALFDRKISEVIAVLFWEAIKAKVSCGNVLAIGGMESGAIPLISILTLKAPKEFIVSGFFIRKSRKKSDLANDIEGKIPEGSTIIIVDDILNQGKSFEKIKKILENNHKTPSVYFSIIRYRDELYYKEKNLFNNIFSFSFFELNDFKHSLSLKNLSGKSEKFLQTYERLWGLQICKPNPYHVIPKSAPLFNEGIIYWGVDSGLFSAISAGDGKILWNYQVPFGAQGKRIYSSPALYKDIVIFGAYDGNLYALDSLTGKKRWVFFDADWIGSSPCVAEDLKLVFVGLEFGLLKKKGGLAAVNVESGAAVWTYYEMDGLTHASPTYSAMHGIVISGCNNKKVYCFGASKGDLRWVFETEGEVKYGATIDNKYGICYIASMDGSVYGIDIKTGNLVQKFTTQAAIYSNPVLYKDTLIVGSLDKIIYCWDVHTGKLLWTVATNGRIFATGLIYEDKLYIGSNDGRLRVIEPDNGELFGSVLLAERIVNKVIVDRNIIFIPTHACELFAYKRSVNPIT